MKSKQPPKAAAGSSDLPNGGDMDDAKDMDEAKDMDDAGDLGDAGDIITGTIKLAAMSTTAPPTGDQVVVLALRHLGQRYILGARAPMGNANWKGPWDCAEFVSWCVFQTSGVLYGTEPRNDPMMADAFTGFWAQQAAQGGHMIDVELAARVPGAAVLRKPRQGQIGHIVISDGKGGTVEAHSSARGVVKDILSGRRWDCGVLVPGLRYLQAAGTVVLKPAAATLRLTEPLTRGKAVQAVQRQLSKLGFAVGTADGVYGPQTAHAVHLFQASKGLVADGEVGPATLKALGLK